MLERGREELGQAVEVVDERAAGHPRARTDGDGGDARPAVLDEEVERGLHEGLKGRRGSLCLSPSRHAERLPDKYIDVCIILTPSPPLL